MKYEISNEYLKVKADTEGAILWSVTDKDGFEYIWQGDYFFLTEIPSRTRQKAKVKHHASVI